MKVYTIEEPDYSELTDYLKDLVKCGKKWVERMEGGEFGARMNRRYRDDYDEDDDYTWKIKKGRYNY